MSTETRPARRSKRRRIVACQRCHGYKIKCSGGNPCNSCRSAPRSVECVYPVKDRQVPVSEVYLQQLQDEVTSLKSKSQSHAGQGVADAQLSRGGRLTSPRPPSVTESPHSSVLDNPLVTGQRPRMVQTDGASQLEYLGDASGIAFGMKLQDLMTNQGHHFNPPLFQTELRHFTHPALLRTSKIEFRLPEKSYALILVRILKRFLGDTHHLNLGTAFTQRLGRFYTTETEDPRWICRLFLVFALGELYSNNISKRGAGDSEIPGTSFFLSAISLLQDAFEGTSISYVETLILASLYSDALNRTNSAYAYIGLALRMSLTLGLHRNTTDAQMSAADKEHRNRVWWTVYYLERLCSSKLGHPMMLRDEDISTALPSAQVLPEQQDRYEFPDPSIMIAQLQLARIVGSISRDLYVTTRQVGGPPFLHNVHSIFTSLKIWNEQLPDQLKHNGQSVHTSRSISSLHLLFNQCVILTTRPILLAVFQLSGRVGGTSESRPIQELPDVAKTLADNCIQAARNINQMLIQLWVDGSIAMFSYTDALILFTSSMILMIAVVLDDSNSNGSQDDREKAENAWRLMTSMRDFGNIAAAGFHHQLVQLRVALGLSGPSSGPAAAVLGEPADAPTGAGMEHTVQSTEENTFARPSGYPQTNSANFADFGDMQQQQLSLGSSDQMATVDGSLDDMILQGPGNEWNGLPFSISMDDLNDSDLTAFPFLWD